MEEGAHESHKAAMVGSQSVLFDAVSPASRPVPGSPQNEFVVHINEIAWELWGLA